MFDLSLIGRVRIGVLGDAALDVHWYADMKKSELSRETPHYPLPVVREEFSPGAAVTNSSKNSCFSKQRLQPASASFPAR